MEAGRELDALVAQKVMGLNVRGWALAYIDEMSCWCIEHPDEPERGDPEDLRAVHTTRELQTICYLDECEPEDWGPDGIPAWALRDEKDIRRIFARDLEEWGTTHDYLDAVPDYSTSIAAAWEVVEKLKEDGMMWCIYDTPGGVKCGINRAPMECLASVEAATAPLAVCLAALKAMGIEV